MTCACEYNGMMHCVCGADTSADARITARITVAEAALRVVLQNIVDARDYQRNRGKGGQTTGSVPPLGNVPYSALLHLECTVREGLAG